MDQAVLTNSDGTMVLRINGAEVLATRDELLSLSERIHVAIVYGESISPEYQAIHYEHQARVGVSSEERFLVLHKVRGAPSFDIAIRTEIAGEEAWILDTGGWRCFPHQSWPLTQLWFNREYVPTEVELPDDLPDIFSCTPPRATPKRQMELDEILGF